MGRHKEFDRTVVLRKAMRVFWKRGFDSTSVPDLMDAMDLSKSSFYEEFGDKNSLFEQTLDLYSDEVASKLIALLVNAPSVRKGFVLFFEEQIRGSTSPTCPGGCFLTNTAVTLETLPGPLAKKIRSSVDTIQSLFALQFKKAQDRREISKNQNPASLAILVMGTSMGINVMARLNQDPASLQKMADTFISSVFLSDRDSLDTSNQSVVHDIEASLV